MRLARRRFLRLTAGAVALLPAMFRLARAQSYPNRPVRIIVGFAAGGINDVAARLIGQSLSERLGQPFVVENRAGASGNIATEAVVNAPPDGHTLLLIGSSNTINPTLYEKLNFNFAHDIVPVAGIIRAPLVMEVNPAFPARTVAEFMTYARANPGKINMASGGSGTSVHMAGELFSMMTGVRLVHVPYRGEGPALSDLMGGQVQVMFSNMPASLEFVRAGKLRALAVTTATRSEALPDLPTVGEFVPSYEASGIGGLGAPRGTPAPIVDMLNQQINTVLSDPRMKKRLADLGATALVGSPADFGKLLADEIEKWARVVKFSDAKPD
jgi:tripartite-type tricarboxylate transporter receptor subunit TctC